MTAADLKTYFSRLHRTRPSKLTEPTIGISDRRDLDLWELFQRFGRIPGVRIVAEPVVDWPDERVENFDRLMLWDAWAAQAPIERIGIAARMAAMADLMRAKKW